MVWTRLLTLLLGGTVYTFSLILAAFLTGLGIGSSAGAALAKNVKNPRNALGVCQLLLVVALAWAAYSQTTALPNWPVNPALAPDAMSTFQIDLIRALWVVLPGAILWGMSFPLALAAIAREGPGPGTAGRLGVRGQHGGRHLRRHARQPVRARQPWHAGQPARADDDRRGERAAHVHARVLARDPGSCRCRRAVACSACSRSR